MPGEVPCYGDATVNYMNQVAAKFYSSKQLNGADRYLIILSPMLSNNCEWAAKSIVGDYRTPFGITVLQDNSIPYVLTHELGHALGLGHSNLFQCDTAGDHPWADCKNVDYGGAVDLMSNIETNAPLNIYHRWRTGAIDSTSMLDVSTNTNITLSSIDSTSGIRGVHIHEGDSVYWIEYRKTLGDMLAGLYVYRSDTPPVGTSSSSVSSEFNGNYTGDSSGDVWLENLGDYKYGIYPSGSPSAWNFTTYRGGVSLAATPIPGNPDQVQLDVQVASGTVLQSLPPQAPDLSRFSISSRDFGSLYTVAQVPGGDTLNDATLQLCNASFASESHRVARNQMAATPLGNSKYQFISSEVVQYENAAWAQTALQELDKALAGCSPKIATVQKLKYVAPSGISSRSFLYLSPKHATVQNLMATFQVKGKILVGSYQVSNSNFTAADISKWQRLARVIGGRLLSQNVSA
jgi:hypothetical protein